MNRHSLPILFLIIFGACTAIDKKKREDSVVINDSNKTLKNFFFFNCYDSMSNIEFYDSIHKSPLYKNTYSDDNMGLFRFTFKNCSLDFEIQPFYYFESYDGSDIPSKQDNSRIMLIDINSIGEKINVYHKVKNTRPFVNVKESNKLERYFSVDYIDTCSTKEILNLYISKYGSPSIKSFPVTDEQYNAFMHRNKKLSHQEELNDKKICDYVSNNIIERAQITEYTFQDKRNNSINIRLYRIINLNGISLKEGNKEPLSISITYSPKREEQQLNKIDSLQLKKERDKQIELTKKAAKELI